MEENRNEQISRLECDCTDRQPCRIIPSAMGAARAARGIAMAILSTGGEKFMRLVLNGINGRYLREIPDNAVRDTEMVEAAVAYATSESLLFDWCWENNIPLRFWGRFDETIPVSLGILRTFLERRSPNFTCKLLKHFHAKVIWWHGVGAYIGSANLTDAAWYNNIEAGCFFEDADTVASGIDIQLQAFFRRIDENASPLSEELYRAIESRARELQRLAEQDRDRHSPALDFESSRLNRMHNVVAYRVNGRKIETFGSYVVAAFAPQQLILL
jgi:phosphatidylserine/phosphatidylglycerophosphate/cardiolipin synthase-like enzyme